MDGTGPEAAVAVVDAVGAEVGVAAAAAATGTGCLKGSSAWTLGSSKPWGAYSKKASTLRPDPDPEPKIKTP